MDIYIVAAGDTLHELAQRFGTTPERIATDNAILEPARISVGQALVIRRPARVYTVKEGDTLHAVAQMQGVALWALLRANPAVLAREEIYPGQTLCLPDPVRARTLDVSGYAYPYIDLQVLRMQLPYLTWLHVFAYTFSADGTLNPVEDAPLLELARRYQVAPVLVLAGTDTAGNFTTATSAQLLADEGASDRLIDGLERAVVEKGYFGVDVDLEYIGADNRAHLTGFVTRLAERMHAIGRQVFVALPPKVEPEQRGALYEGHDYRALGEVADHVLLMTYEWGYSHGPAMAVAPIAQVRAVAEYALREIAPEKILLGRPNYGYDWTLPFVPGQSAHSIGNVEATNIAWRRGAEIEFDEGARAPFFRYTDALRRAHEVRFEDPRSVKAALSLAEELGLPGVGIWQIMRYFPQMYLVMDDMFDIRKLPPQA